ncbi:hypothetical protein LAD67_15610 [Escherichia coli]|nr:hypothetical protein [Escherichia coli]
MPNEYITQSEANAWDAVHIEPYASFPVCATLDYRACTLQHGVDDYQLRTKKLALTQ